MNLKLVELLAKLEKQKNNGSNPGKKLNYSGSWKDSSDQAGKPNYSNLISPTFIKDPSPKDMEDADRFISAIIDLFDDSGTRYELHVNRTTQPPRIDFYAMTRNISFAEEVEKIVRNTTFGEQTRSLRVTRKGICSEIGTQGYPTTIKELGELTGRLGKYFPIVSVSSIYFKTHQMR